MLFPKKVKHRRWQVHRKNLKKDRVDTRGLDLHFGSYGLVATSPERVRSNQIESARKILSKTIGKLGRYWIRIFPDRPFTQKAAEVGMGKGKGNLEGYCFEVLPGRIIFEVDSVPEAVAREALRKAGTKLPIKVKIIKSGDIA